MAGEDGEGAIDLLGQNDAGEFVGESHRTKREERVGAEASGRRPSVGRSDGEDERLDA